MSTEPANDRANEMISDLASGYERMLSRIRARLAEAEASAPLPIYMAIEEARERAIELGEMTQAEAGQVAYWLKRDLLHLRDVISRTERGMKTWLGIDLGLLEKGLLNILADPTRVDWLKLQQEFDAAKQASAAAATQHHEQQPKPGKAQKP